MRSETEYASRWYFCTSGRNASVSPPTHRFTSNQSSDNSDDEAAVISRGARVTNPVMNDWGGPNDTEIQNFSLGMYPLEDLRRCSVYPGTDRSVIRPAIRI